MLLSIEGAEEMYLYSWGEVENLRNRAVQTREKRGIIVLKKQERTSQMCRAGGEKPFLMQQQHKNVNRIPYQSS
jgi:hypothetical protein